MLSALLLLAVPAFNTGPVAPLFHEDDPKLLANQPPYAGPGFQGLVPAPGMNLQLGSSSGFTADGVTLLSWLPLGSLGGAPCGNDCWGYTSPSGREYAIMGTSTDTAFIDLSSPQNAQVISIQDGPDSLWRDIKTYQQYAYAVSEGGDGIQVFDLGQIDNGAVSFLGTVTSGGGTTTATHNVAIDEESGFLYRTGGSSNGLRIYDLNNNPASPQFVGSWSTKYVHDAQIVRYPDGTQLAYCCGGFNGGFDNTGLSIVDVTNKNNPTVIREVFWPNAEYSHQIWLSADRKYAYLNDELDEDGSIFTTSHIINVEDPDNAFYVGAFTNDSVAVGHNLYVHNDLIFEANYRSGLRIFDTVNPTNPNEVAFFDTYPGDDLPEFNGLWSVYPYFDSGVVIGSDRERGLFVWWIGDPELQVSVVNPPSLIGPNGDIVDVSISQTAPGDLVAGTEMLHYDAGNGLVSIPLTNIGSGNYQANFPSIDCGTPISYFVSAEADSGLVWYDPPNAPSEFFSTISGFDVVQVFDDEMENNSAGWTSGASGDTATTGIWERVNPVGTASQPEDDHTPGGGTDCWVTGQGFPGGGTGDNDIDGGETTLLSPVFDLSGQSNPILTYWRWYSNNQNSNVDDSFFIDINNGSGWVNLETIAPGNPQASGGWFEATFPIADFVSLTSNVQVRFRASDLGDGSLVEAAVDDFDIQDVDCTPTAPEAYCIGKISSLLCFPLSTFSGLPSATSPSSFDIGAISVNNNRTGLMFYGYGLASLPFQGGTLCVNPPLRRTAVQFSGGTNFPNMDCSGELSFDFNALIQSGADPLLTIGTEIFSQNWFRDPGDGSFGSGLSDGLRFIIQP